MNRLREYVDNFKKDNPMHAIEAEDFYALCVAEIEQGGSPSHERSLCYSSLDDLINDDDDT